MKIELNEVRIKNFLCFGAKWQKVPLYRGVNIVTGWDEDKNRNNGSGKSSLLEAILFVLYGQTHKNIKKEQIVNWKNRKDCEVQIDFNKENVNFTVNRAIKPDKFEIFINNTLLDKPSHVRDYQKILDEILGMNYPTFMSLIYTNLNKSIPILSMKKPEKRKFIEKAFGLELFTYINDLSNKKIKGLNEKTREMQLKAIGNNSVIEKTNENIRKFDTRLKEIKNSDVELKEVKSILEEKLKEHGNSIKQLEDIKHSIEKLEKDRDYNNNIRQRIETKYDVFNMKLKSIVKIIKDIEVGEKLNEKQIKKINDFTQKYGNLDVLTQKIEMNTNTIQKLDYNLDEFSRENQNNEIILAEARVEHKSLIEKIKNLKDKKECPLCGQNIEDISIIAGLNLDLISINNRIGKCLKFKNQYEKSIQASRDMIELEKNNRRENQKLKDKLVELELNKGSTDTNKKEKLENDKTRYEKVLVSLLAAKGSKIVKINYIDKKLSLFDEQKYELEKILEEVTILENKKKNLDEKVSIETKQKQEYLGIIKESKETIEKLVEENNNFDKAKNKLKELIDYLEYVKVLCKDEEVKQYAISSIIPYLNKKTNEYLAEIDFSFFTQIDSWLDATIRGPGITKGSYGSLSGGEGRAIDLSLQLGLLDIGRMKAGTWPDCVFYDEILDSSIDAEGLEKLIHILNSKQIRENNKTFIISHRENINESIKFDHNYHITKKDGYSKIEVK